MLLVLLLLLSHFSHVQLCATPWMAAHQAPLSLGFSRQEFWSGLPFPSLHPSDSFSEGKQATLDNPMTLWSRTFFIADFIYSQKHLETVPPPLLTCCLESRFCGALGGWANYPAVKTDWTSALPLTQVSLSP